MRLIRNSIYILVFLGLFFTSCQDLAEYNENPEVSSFADPNQQLNYVQMVMQGNLHEHWHMNLGMLGGIAQHYAGPWEMGAARAVWAGHEYTYVDWWENAWNTTYKNIVDLVERTTQNPEYVNVNSAARILKVLTFARLTDAFGDIPYFEAGKSYYTGNFDLPYDRQEDIYNDFFLELDAAVKAFDANQPAITIDGMYNGDIEQWQKFGNSLRLRLAMRLVKVDLAKAEQEARAAIGAPGGVFTSNADIAMIQHMSFADDEDLRNNPSSAVLNRSGFSDFGICATLSDELESTNDPRLHVLFAGYAGNDKSNPNIIDVIGYNGLVPASYAWDAPAITGTDGVERGFYDGGYLLTHGQLVDKDDPSLLLTYAEVEFYLAEAAERWGIGGSAADHYNAGVEAAMQQLTVYGLESEITDTQIEDYLTENPYSSAASDTLINTQLWIQYFLNGHEAFGNWRRSDIPALETPPAVDWEAQLYYGIPRRLPYPDEELDRNLENITEAIERLEANGATAATRHMDGRVWWDAE